MPRVLPPCCLVLILLAAGPAAGGEPVTILQPPQNAVVRGGGVAALVVMAGEGRLVARLNDDPLPSPTEVGPIRHWVIRLRAGRNVLAVGPAEGPMAATREIVYAAPFFDEARIPIDFAARPFHGSETAQDVCAGCHKLMASRTDPGDRKS